MFYVLFFKGGGDEMQNRIKQIRKSFSLTQTEFSTILGLTKNFISLLETGERTPSDRTIIDICGKFGVSETWLRTGAGEPFLPKTREEEIGEIVKAASNNDPDEAIKFFTALLEDMSEAEIMLMYEVFRRHFPK